MELVVDLEKVTAVVHDVDDLSTWRVTVAAPLDASPDSIDSVHRLEDVLRATNVARLEDEGVAWLWPDSLRFHAAGQVPEDWEDRFARVCQAALNKGGDVELRATVHWPAGAASAVAR